MTYQDDLSRATTALQAARAALSDEIKAYPTPISGCDAQFNHLLDQRHRITAALSQLDTPIFVPTPRAPSESSGVESR